MLLSTTVLVKHGSRTRIYPVGPKPLVETHLGAGRLAYLVDDGWVGVLLSGERVAQEFGAATVKVVA